MSMHNIPQKDKETVIKRLAEGESYSQAMKETEIQSKDTVHRIAKQHSNDIERKRAQYLKKIKKFGASDEKRAKMWATMMVANKVRVSGDRIYWEPDWQTRITALKYIDSLGNMDKATEMKLELNDITPLQLPSETEATDFSQKFKEFLDKES